MIVYINDELVQVGLTYEADEVVINVHCKVEGSTNTVYKFNYRKKISDSKNLSIFTVIAILTIILALLLLFCLYLHWKKSKLLHSGPTTPPLKFEDLSEAIESPSFRSDDAPHIMYAPNP